ncbi:hypothetical protein CEXT_28011, partial [Caerostris extrusa]
MGHGPTSEDTKGFPVLGGIQDISRREVSQAVKWDSWKENVLGQFEGTIVVGICFMRGDELSFPRENKTFRK